SVAGHVDGDARPPRCEVQPAPVEPHHLAPGLDLLAGQETADHRDALPDRPGRPLALDAELREAGDAGAEPEDGAPAPTVMRDVWCAASVSEPYTSRKKRSSASQKWS